MITLPTHPDTRSTEIPFLLNIIIPFEHEQIDSANHFYRTVSITIHNPQ